MPKYFCIDNCCVEKNSYDIFKGNFIIKGSSYDPIVTQDVVQLRNRYLECVAKSNKLYAHFKQRLTAVMTRQRKVLAISSYNKSYDAPARLPEGRRIHMDIINLIKEMKQQVIVILGNRGLIAVVALVVSSAARFGGFNDFI